MTKPQLHLVDTATGEVVEDDRDALIDQLTRDLHGKQVALGKLRREISELRAVEPEGVVIRDILEYWSERCAPKAVLAPGGKRWEKTRDRLREPLHKRKPWTPEELKLAIDGALLDPWLNGTARGSKGYLDPQTIFRDSEMVEKLRNLAIGFKATAGIALSDLLDVAGQLGFVNWKHLLQVCMCDHRRVEHSRPDPNRVGRETCLVPECVCDDFDMDFCDPFNVKSDSWLQRWAA